MHSSLTTPAGLVALRIWWLNRAIMTFSNHSYHPIIFLVLESGAVYSATLITLLILYKTGSWFQYVLLDAVRHLRDSSRSRLTGPHITPWLTEVPKWACRSRRLLASSSR